MSRRRPRLPVEDIGDVAVVQLTDDMLLDGPTIQAVGEQLLGLVGKADRKNLLLSFGDVQCLGGAFLGTLVALNQKVNAAGGRLVLCNLPPGSRAFQAAKLDKLFQIERERGGGDPDGSGVAARLKPPRPSGGGSGALPPPEGER